MGLKVNNALRTMKKMIESGDADQIDEAIDFIRDASTGGLEADGFKDLTSAEQDALNAMMRTAINAKISLRDANGVELSQGEKVLSQFPPSDFPSDFDDLVKLRQHQFDRLGEMDENDAGRDFELNKLVGITNALRLAQGELISSTIKNPDVTRIGSLEDMRQQAEAAFEQRFQTSELEKRQAETQRQLADHERGIEQRREAFRSRELSDYDREQQGKAPSVSNKPEGYFQGSAFDDSMRGL